MYLYVSNNNDAPTDIISNISMLTSTPPSAPIPIKQRHRSSFSQTRKRRPSESTSRLAHFEDRDRLASSKLQATISPGVPATATFTTTPSGALALSLSPPGLGSGLSKSAPLENESISGQSHRRKGTTFKCETCAKVYRHPSCLVKHRWEHSPHWHEASKFLLSKHQQVQLLEAAAILSHLSPATAGGTSLPDDRSLWPTYLSGGSLPLSPPGHPALVSAITAVNPKINSVQESVGLNSASTGAPIHASSGTAGSQSTVGSVVGVKVEVSAEDNIPLEAEDFTSNEDEANIEMEFDEDLDIDIDGDTDGDDNNIHQNDASNGTRRGSTIISGSGARRPIATTTTQASSVAPSKSSTPQLLSTPATAMISGRAGLTEIRPGLLGHPNPPNSPSSTSFTPGPSFGTGQTQDGVLTSPWTYRYSSQPSFNSSGAIYQASSVNAVRAVHTQMSQCGPFASSAPLSVPPFPHTHSAAYSSSPGPYTISHSFSPAGSLSGPFSSLSLSLPYASSPLEEETRPKGLSLPRSSVRSSSTSDDEDRMVEDDETSINSSTSQAATKRKYDCEEEFVVVPTPRDSGEWEMEI